jgi:hypothetical protein
MEFDAKTKITPGSWYEKHKFANNQACGDAGHDLRCDRTHRHCQLEGQVPGFGISRTSFLEDYQPCLAATMAAALAVPESAVFWEDALAVNEDKLIHGKMIQLLTENKAEAVGAVQRLHRNLGHPTTTALVEMLEARGASSAVLEVARTFQCHACLKYRKPNQVAPASTKVISRFNQPKHPGRCHVDQERPEQVPNFVHCG